VDISAGEQGVYAFGPFRLDPFKRRLLRGEAVATLPPKLFDTLKYLVENPNRVVGKEELMAALWPGRIVEEGSLSQTIFSLRKVLGGAGDMDRCIVTAPGRGYRFTAPIHLAPRWTPPAAADAPAAPAVPVLMPLPDADSAGIPAARSALRFSRRSLRLALAIGVLAALAGGLLYASLPGPAAAPPIVSNSIVLADFVNQTGDTTFDAVPGKVLEIDLEQSPFLNLMPQHQVGETLQQMERPRDAKLTPELAREVCARNQGKAVLSGTIAAIGSRYIVTLEASDCYSGKSLAQGKTETSSKEDVPQALDGLSERMRESLYEALASIHQFDVPVAQATTASFDALVVFSRGEQFRAQGNNAASTLFFKRAIELDPSFALAHEELGGAYRSLRELELSSASLQTAFNLRDRTNELEKLLIVTNYYQYLGDYTAALQSCRLWAQIYPQDARAWSTLANILTRMARYPEAIEYGTRGLRLAPEHSASYMVLARAYARAARYAEARALGRQAAARGLDGWDLHCLLYEIAFTEGDTAAMAEQVAMEKGQPGEIWMLESQAQGAAAAGQLKQFRVLIGQAIEAAKAQGPDARTEFNLFVNDYVDVLTVFGLKQEAGKVALEASGQEDNTVELAEVGDFAGAANLAAAQGKRHPSESDMVDINIPLTQAQIDLGQGKPDQAITALQADLPYELRDFRAPFLLGQAYLETRQPDLAAAEYRKILDNRGVDGLSPLYPLAYLGLARALHQQGKLPESRAAYEKLFAFWKNADADLPVLLDARREYARLPAQLAAAGQKPG